MSSLTRPIKRGVKALFRPLLRPLLLRLELPLRVLQPRLEALEQAMAQVNAAHGATAGRVLTLEEHSAHDKTLIAALRNENSNLVRGWLRLRSDLLRLEQSVAAPGWVRIAPATLGALAARGGTLRLYVSRDGSRMEGAVNVSEREQAGADLIADLADLPFAPASVDAIAVSGAETDAPPTLVAHWRSLLRPGGSLSFRDG